MSIELKRQIRAHIKDTVSKFYDREQEYRVALVLKDNAVATGIDFNPMIAKDKALDTAVQYGLKQGWIKEVSPCFSFSKALELLKQGDKITRKGWNGADQWLSISCPDTKDVAADNFWSPHNAEFARQNGGSAKVAPCITLKNAQGMIIMGWIPSAGDLFADDWMIAQ
ncbi:DUF2829 domain-containing protein [Acinetobacter lwoffii]|uniref:DUF2829 domain-containing protein n=1 Tax=Acinetobacter lwoffii TaxID=28090 RepID=UPI003BF6B1D7